MPDFCLFKSLTQTGKITEDWPRQGNGERPHELTGNLPPNSVPHEKFVPKCLYSENTAIEERDKRSVHWVFFGISRIVKLDSCFSPDVNNSVRLITHATWEAYSSQWALGHLRPCTHRVLCRDC